MKQINMQSVENTALVSGNHVLNVDEGILSTCLFQKFQSLWNQVSQIHSFSLVVLHLVTDVRIVIPENVENW